MKKLTCTLVLALYVFVGFSYNLNDSLALYLPFTGNVGDSSGNNYVVTNNGATLAPDRFGNDNSAYYFNGNSYMTIPIEQKLPNVNEGGYTISFWVKQDTAAADGGYMMSYGYWLGKGGFSFQYKEGTAHSENYSVAIHQESGSNSIYFNRDNIFSHGWNMVSFTYKNGTLRGYINGCFVKEILTTAYLNPVADFVIGDRFDHSNGITAWIDEVYVYNRALNDLEIAQISEIPGAIRAAGLNIYTLADFEFGELEPVKLGGGWNVYGATGGTNPDTLSYVKVVDNPLKSGANTSEYVGVAVTFPTNVVKIFDYPSRKMEYFIGTNDDQMDNNHHILQWKAMYIDSSIFKVDSIWWLTQNQIHGTFQLFAPPCYGTGQIADGTGGIFNENSIELQSYVSTHDRNRFRFYYRANPDSASVFYSMDIGKWVTFTYDIFWTKADTGYWRLYKDGELLSSRDSVKTLPDCAPDNNSLNWKTGMYSRWNDYIDNEIDSLSFYFDDLELFVNPENNGIDIYDICPKCKFNPCDTTNIVIKGNVQDETGSLQNGEIELIVSGGAEPYTFLWNIGDDSQDLINLSAGTYSVQVTDNNECVKTASLTLNSLNSIADSKLSQSVELLPNPVTDKLEIHTELIPESIIIYTSDGRIISVHENTNLVDASNLNRGVYLVSVIIKNSLIMKKFVKE